MVNNEFFKGSLNPINIYDCIKYNIDFAKNNPDYFKEDGITIFTRYATDPEKLLALHL